MIENYTDNSQAVLKAEEILSDSCITQLPVISRHIAKENLLSVRHVIFKSHMKDVIGCLDIENQDIIINSEFDFKMQNYMIAFQLGYWLLSKQYFLSNPEISTVQMQSSQSRDKNPQEKEAHVFASNLLVPTKFMKKYQEFSDHINLLSDVFVAPSNIIKERLQASNASYSKIWNL